LKKTGRSRRGSVRRKILKRFPPETIRPCKKPETRAFQPSARKSRKHFLARQTRSPGALKNGKSEPLSGPPCPLKSLANHALFGGLSKCRGCPATRPQRTLHKGIGAVYDSAIAAFCCLSPGTAFAVPGEIIHQWKRILSDESPDIVGPERPLAMTPSEPWLLPKQNKLVNIHRLRPAQNPVKIIRRATQLLVALFNNASVFPTRLAGYESMQNVQF
jgi:hypothetical protein